MAEFSVEVSRVWEALRHVEEPELAKDIVAVQMVKYVAVQGLQWLPAVRLRRKSGSPFARSGDAL